MPRLVNGLEQIFTNLGIVGAGYKLFFFETTTTTPKTTYSDPDLQIQNPNPIECDEAGRPEFDIWGADPATYKLILGTPDSIIGNINPIVTIDPVDDLNTNSIINLNPLPAAYWGATTGTSTNYELTALVPITAYSDKQCFFIDFHVACGASPNININEIGAIGLRKYKGDGTVVDLEIGDVQSQRYIAINNGSKIVILNPEHPVNFPANNITWRGLTYLPSGITISNNISDANNDINFSAGVFQFSDGSGQAVASALTKRLDANWAPGTNQGGLDTGSKANNTFYYSYSIYNLTTKISDYICSINASAPTLPTGYTKYKAILNGQFVTDSSGNIIPVIKTGNSTYFVTPIVNLNTTPSVASNIAQSVTVPVQNGIQAMIKVFGATGTGSGDTLSAEFEGSAMSLSGTTDINLIGDAARFSTILKSVPTINGNIKYTIYSASISRQLIIITRGWIDNNV